MDSANGLIIVICLLALIGLIQPLVMKTNRLRQKSVKIQKVTYNPMIIFYFLAALISFAGGAYRLGTNQSDGMLWLIIGTVFMLVGSHSFREYIAPGRKENT